MTVNRYLRLIAGLVLLSSIVLSQLHSLNWIYLTAFVSLNLLQSAFTDWCPMMTILRKIGIQEY